MTDTTTEALPTPARIAKINDRLSGNDLAIERLKRESAERIADSGDVAPEIRTSIVRLEQEQTDLRAALGILQERLQHEQEQQAAVAAAAEQERQRARARIRTRLAEAFDEAVEALGAAYHAWKAESRDSPHQLRRRLPFLLRGALHRGASAFAQALEVTRPALPFRSTFAHSERVLAPAGTFPPVPVVENEEEIL